MKSHETVIEGHQVSYYYDRHIKLWTGIVLESDETQAIASFYHGSKTGLLNEIKQSLTSEESPWANMRHYCL